jgi:hypothetical protein
MVISAPKMVDSNVDIDSEKTVHFSYKKQAVNIHLVRSSSNLLSNTIRTNFLFEILV